MALTDEQYELADRIELWLEARYGRDFAASQIARGVDADLNEVRVVLKHMAIEQHVHTNGQHLTARGHLSRLGRYSARYPQSTE